MSDDLYRDAVRLVQSLGLASTRILQVRFHIGYGLACNLIDRMEKDGLVGPANGSGPRPVLEKSGELFSAAESRG